MNEVAEKELKIVVERAVRPIRATMARKRRMREELLAHLVSIFEEEAQRLGDEQAALEEAKRRFGNPVELTGQLQQAVPRWDRCRSILENMGYRPGESVWHLAAKQFLVTAMIYAIPLLLALPLTFFLGGWFHMGSVPWDHDIGHVLVLGLVLVLFNTVLSLIFASLMNKIGPALAGKRWGRFLLVVLCGFASPFVLSGAFSGAALVFILIVRQATEERRYEKGWA
jgi:hypothetical protein